jgi:16S rRNA C967 or C1407 C5-methylase (RsmB/RsmF family)
MVQLGSMRAKGREAFLSYYQDQFGARAEELLRGLSGHVNPAILFRPDKREQLKQTWSELGYEWKEIDWFQRAVYWPENVAFGAVLPGSRDGYIYPLSISSLVPVAMLELNDDYLVLDACAAPGGKSLASAAHLTDPNEQLVANDVSVDRIIRLRKVLRRFGYEQVQVLRGPAEYTARHYPQIFDRVLIDAPCSSEAHVWKSPKHMAQWSDKRVASLKERQLNLITSLAKAVKPGGQLAYVTCSLTPEENEAVVAQALKRLPAWRLSAGDWSRLPGGPGLSGFGFDPDSVRRVWPDVHGLDPMFTAIFELAR